MTNDMLLLRYFTSVDIFISVPHIMVLFCLSICACVHECRTLSIQYLEEYEMDYHQTYSIDAFYNRHELVRICDL